MTFEHEHDIDRSPLPYSAEIDNLGLLAVLKDFHIVGLQISDRLPVGVGQAKIDLHAAVAVEVFEARIADRKLQRRARRGRDHHRTGERTDGQQADDDAI